MEEYHEWQLYEGMRPTCVWDLRPSGLCTGCPRANKRLEMAVYALALSVWYSRLYGVYLTFLLVLGVKQGSEHGRHPVSTPASGRGLLSKIIPHARENDNHGNCMGNYQCC